MEVILIDCITKVNEISIFLFRVLPHHAVEVNLCFHSTVNLCHLVLLTLGK
jgi:hypothetical protein